MSRDEFRALIQDDPALLNTAALLAALIERSETPLREALETGDLETVATALGLDVADLQRLGNFFYERASLLAERFPALRDQASRWGPLGESPF